MRSDDLVQRRIPKSEYYKTDDGEYVTYDLIKQYHSSDEIKRFNKFMFGQTVAAIEIEGKQISGIFTWDYERWLKGGMIDKQGADWD